MNEFPDIASLTLYKEKVGITYDDMSITDRVTAQFFKTTLDDGRELSFGLFSHNNKQLYCAWGYMDEEHCSMYAIMGEDNEWLPPQVGCPIKIPIKDGNTIIGLKMPTLSGARRFYFKGIEFM